jgi:hypothetical protein
MTQFDGPDCEPFHEVFFIHLEHLESQNVLLSFHKLLYLPLLGIRDKIPTFLAFDLTNALHNTGIILLVNGVKMFLE